MLLSISLTGVDANFLVDVAAAVTIVSSHVFGRIDADHRPPLRNPTVPTFGSC